MDNEVKRLANIRAELEREKRALEALEDKLFGTDTGLTVIGAREVVKRLREEEKQARGALDGVALQIFLNDGDKQPHTAVTIKKRASLDYKPIDAIKWAYKADQFSLISLNTSAFEKVARELDLDFVEKTKEPYTNVPKDISEYRER